MNFSCTLPSPTCAQAQPAWPSNTPSSIPRVCRHVAALRRSSIGAFAGRWLLSKPITDDRFLPSNSGTCKVKTLDLKNLHGRRRKSDLFSVHKRAYGPWSCTRWPSGWSWPAAVWGCSSGGAGWSGNFSPGGGVASRGRRTTARWNGDWWSRAGPGAAGMVTDCRPAAWREAGTWAAETSRAWLEVSCRHRDRHHYSDVSKHAAVEGRAENRCYRGPQI